jgi:hypothetical protein
VSMFEVGCTDVRSRLHDQAGQDVAGRFRSG